MFFCAFGTQKGEELEADEEKAEAAKLGMGSLRDTERCGKSYGKPKEHDSTLWIFDIFTIYTVYIYIYPRCSMVLEYLPTFRVIFRVNVGIYKYSSTMEHIWVLFLYVNLLVANVCVFAWMVFDDVGSSEDAWFQPWNAGLNLVFKEKETLNIGTGDTKILGLQTQP